MVLQVQTITLIDALAIILSIVSLIITAVGFFASLKFYRDGVELQAKANDALTKLEERTHFIQAQVSGMFDKTLDAAIGKREALAGTFKELTEQLESAKSRIIEESLSQIDAAGEQERKRLAQVVDNEIKLLQDKVKTTEESVQDLALEDAPHGYRIQLEGTKNDIRQFTNSLSRSLYCTGVQLFPSQENGPVDLFFLFSQMKNIEDFSELAKQCNVKIMNLSIFSGGMSVTPA
jgi:hypothetical protein